jgi:hypothetical protein
VTAAGTRSAAPPPVYRQLLDAAYELGRSDGGIARDFEPADTVDVLPPPRCRGRTPEQFARQLWGSGPGDPPSGLLVNAPVWYGLGFTAGRHGHSSSASSLAVRAAPSVSTGR